MSFCKQMHFSVSFFFLFFLTKNLARSENENKNITFIYVALILNTRTLKMAERSADMSYSLCCFLVSLCCFFATKTQFHQEYGMSLTLLKTGMVKPQQLQSMSTLFDYNSRRKFNNTRSTQRKSFLVILILICGDIEHCSGPTDVNCFCKQKGIKFVHQNIRGLVYNLPHLETFISNTHSKVDVISLSETHYC